MNKSAVYKKTSILFLLIIGCISLRSQCPQDSAEMILNSQEKYDAFFENYPDCDEYTVLKMNGKFMGDPRPIKYISVLLLILVGVLSILKLFSEVFKD